MTIYFYLSITVIILIIVILIYNWLVLLRTFCWINRKRWVRRYQEYGPGNDIPDRPFKQINSQKKHTPIVDKVESQIMTKNMFLDSFRVLNLNIFSKEELSEQMINDAYSKKLSAQINCIQKGIETGTDISALKSAREYLIKSLDKPLKS